MATNPVFTFLPLAQANSWDDAPAAPPESKPAAHPMTFSDLQGAMHDYTEGKTTGNTFRNGTLILLAVTAVIALLIHWRQKRKTAGPPDSLGRLGREIGRLIRFPLGTRLLLKWVAASTKVPFPSLLLSSALFDKSVNEWARGSTFGVLRAWGKGRLERLKAALFEVPGAV